jgi:hypothetical protein
MVTNVADLSVLRHSLAAGKVEALKYFRAVPLIQKNGGLKSQCWISYLVEIFNILPFGTTFAIKVIRSARMGCFIPMAYPFSRLLKNEGES